MEQRTELGLVKGHAYGITAVKRIPLGETNLVNFFKSVFDNPGLNLVARPTYL